MWSGANTIALRVGNIALMAVVVRLVTPREFGVFAVAVTVHAVIANMAALGSIAILTRADTDPDAIAPTVGTIAFLSAAVMATAIWMTAPWLAPALGSADAVDAMRVMSLAVLMVGVFAVPGAMLARDFRQDRIFAANMIAFVPSNALLLVLAVSGDGALAFAWSRVVGQVIAGAYMTYSVERRYRFGFDRTQAKFVLGAGLPIAGADLINTILLNADYAFVGRILGPARLGIYVLAFNIANWTTWLLGAMVNSVAMPAFSRFKVDKEQLRHALVRANRVIALVAWPTCALTLASAGPLVETIYGKPWVGAAPVLAVLAPYAVILTHSLVFSNFLVGTGHGRVLLLIQVIWLATLVPMMALGIYLWGTTGVAVAHVIVICVVVMPAYLIAVDRLTGVSPRGIVRAVRPAVLGAVAAGAVDFAITSVVTPAWLALITGLFGGAVIYAACTASQLQTLLPHGSTSRLGRSVSVARAVLNSADRPRRLLVHLGSGSDLVKSK